MQKYNQGFYFHINNPSYYFTNCLLQVSKMTKSYPLKIFAKILDLFALIKIDFDKIYHCPSNEQVQIGNQTVLGVFNGEVRLEE